MPSPPPPLASLTGIDDALGRVEAALSECVRSDDEFLTQVAGHLIGAGGKRVRPALCVVASTAGGGELTDDAVMGGVSVELVHLGSLYHDDVMDEAATRRSVESVNARWGNLVAILAGDFLLAKASEIASSLGTDIAGLLAATIGRLCEGQVRELQHAFDTTRTVESYLAAIAGKTAALTATSCRIGGLVAALDPPQVDALTDYGEAYGMVFQIVDDVLDVIATDEQLGKPAGNDMVEGVYTLPVITALGTDVGGELRDLLGAPLDPEQSVRARELVRADGAVDAAIATARDWADRAVKALTELPPSPARDALEALAHHTVDRVG